MTFFDCVRIYLTKVLKEEALLQLVLQRAVQNTQGAIDERIVLG